MRIPVEIYGVYLAAFNRLEEWRRSLSKSREESDGKSNDGEVGLGSLIELPEEVDEQEPDRDLWGEIYKGDDDLESLSRPRVAMSSMNEGTAAMGQTVQTPAQRQPSRGNVPGPPLYKCESRHLGYVPRLSCTDLLLVVTYTLPCTHRS